jgi:glycosyltransferase involved in cell wall biosynthesis
LVPAGRAPPFFQKELLSSTEIPTLLNLLTFTTLYPNPSQPNHGVFVENRLRHLVGTGQARATVLAPIAWCPGRNLPRAPGRENRAGLDVLHPRWLALPKLGMSVSPWLLYLSAARALENLIRGGARFDAIDAHYFYPDGVAAIWLGRRFDLPVCITARGSDVTQFPDYRLPRRLIVSAACQAEAIVSVSSGLRDALVALGAPAANITVLRNGVDLAVFRPLDRALARKTFNVDGPVLLSVGALIPRKGHDRTIAALTRLPGWTLLIAGEGTEREALLALARRLGVRDRLRLLGALPHGDMAQLYSAADLSVLASSREGWANVLLESMACGTPVIASPIPGNPEVVQTRAAGIIADANTGEAIAQAVKRWEHASPDRAATRAYAESFSWDATSQGQLALFRGIVEKRKLGAGSGLGDRPVSR